MSLILLQASEAAAAAPAPLDPGLAVVVVGCVLAFGLGYLCGVAR